MANKLSLVLALLITFSAIGQELEGEVHDETRNEIIAAFAEGVPVFVGGLFETRIESVQENRVIKISNLNSSFEVMVDLESGRKVFTLNKRCSVQTGVCIWQAEPNPSTIAYLDECFCFDPPPPPPEQLRP